MSALVFLTAVNTPLSAEKDGSPLSDEKQTIQTSLFALLKDFLKSPTPEELHCVLAYVLSVGEERQVMFLSLDLLFPT